MATLHTVESAPVPPAIVRSAPSGLDGSAAIPDRSVFRDCSDRLADVFEHDLFFIVGCEKSGTSWLQHLLNSHPQIVCRGESRIGLILLPLLRQAVEVWNQNQLLGESAAFTDAGFAHLARTAAALVLDHAWPVRARTKVIGEKTPGHAKVIDELATLFPHARFIHIVRDGRDGAVSGWHHNLHRGRPDFRQRFPRFADYARYYVQAHWLPYISSAQAFGSRCPRRYHEVRYEDLHRSPEMTTARMLEFLDVEGGEDAIAACVEGGSFEKLTHGRHRGEARNESHFRKGVVGDWRTTFDPVALSAFLCDGGRDMLVRLGYDANLEPTPMAQPA